MHEPFYSSGGEIIELNVPDFDLETDPVLKSENKVSWYLLYNTYILKNLMRLMQKFEETLTVTLNLGYVGLSWGMLAKKSMQESRCAVR